MKKVVTGFIALSCLLASAAALSWGGLVDNNTRFSSNDDFTRLALNQSNGIYFSVNSNLDIKLFIESALSLLLLIVFITSSRIEMALISPSTI